MKAALFLLLASCSPFEALCSRSDNCGSNLDRTIEGFAIRDGDQLTLLDGSRIAVRVLFGTKIQAFGEDVMNTSGLCGMWSPETRTVTLAIAPDCGPIEVTLLHELGHVKGLSHGRGIMANGNESATQEQIAELFGEVIR